MVALPAVMYSGVAIVRRFRKTDQSVRGVLMAQAHATLIALPAAWVTAFAVVVTTRVAGAWWWALAGLGLAGVLVGAAQTAPRVFARLGRARPLTRRDLAERLADLARHTGVGVAGIDQWDVAETARVTALVLGIGRTRRIFLSADTLRDWTDDEIAVVVAHELAHHAHHDLWRTLVLDALVLVFGLWIADRAVGLGAPALGLAGPGDLAALPLMALVAGAVWVALTPLRHAQSRAHERKADCFALALTGADDAFGAAIRRLGTHYLAEERPSLVTRWLYHRHPSVEERLALAASFREQRTRGVIVRSGPS
jgi:STE24 endopeptidase